MTKEKKQWHTLKWFKSRIGKTIYRKPNDWCNCEMCQRTDVKISKEYNHADYLFTCQNELDISYQDKKI